MEDKAKVAVMVSLEGTNLQSLIDAQRSGLIDKGEITLVISNKEGSDASERARAAGIETHVITRKGCGGEEAFEEACKELIDSRNIDLIVLAGFLTVLSRDFVTYYDHRIINIHPSLIPAFCGDGYYGLIPHRAALERGVKVTGASVHYVNEIADGGEIIAQKAVNVEDGDTPETLQKRVMEQAEWLILPAAVAKICRGIVKDRQQKRSAGRQTARTERRI